MKIVILDAFAENPGDLSWDALNAFGEVEIYDRTPAPLIVERARGAEIVVTNKTPLSAETLSQLPEVRFIALLSTGSNVVDLAYARSRGIPVSNIPSYSTESVAQLVFAFLLEHTRQVALHSASVRNGDWARCADFCYALTPLTDIKDKTIGIIGYGSIGRAVARIALAFGMRVLVNTPSRPEGAEGAVRFCDRDTLLAQSDFVTLHCPLNAQTEGLVNKTFLRQMKRTAILINTSRGPVVNAEDLAEALNSGAIAGAGLDVLSSEPPAPDDPLLRAKNCFITPHIAWASYETRQRLMDIFIGNIEAFLNGAPRNTVG